MIGMVPVVVSLLLREEQIQILAVALVQSEEAQSVGVVVPPVVVVVVVVATVELEDMAEEAAVIEGEVVDDGDLH